MEDPAETFLWYDLETSGTSPAHDRIVQFASLRTDADLTPVEPPFSTYVQLGPEVVPWPESLLVTGIAPQTLASGLPEWEAMTEILRIFETPRTCVVGYNNLLFDDEFIRYTLYRNLLDPYAREWRDGNSRWDIMDLVRAAGALRPEGIEWPVVEGKPAFGLQAIAEVNGLSHKNPHDALSDVHATIGVAGLIRTRQPRLYRYGLSLRSKDAARRMLVPFGREICIHAARSFGRERYGTAPVLSIAQHPEIDASIIVADLGRDVSALIEDSAEDLAEALFAKGAEERPPLHQVRLNRCPFLAPLGVLRPADAQRIGIDRDLVRERQAALAATPISTARSRRSTENAKAKAATDSATWKNGSTRISFRMRTVRCARAFGVSCAPGHPGRILPFRIPASAHLPAGCALECARSPSTGRRARPGIATWSTA